MSIRGLSAFAVAVTALGSLATAIPAAAQSNAPQEPQRTTATFQDWLVQCRMSEGEAPAAPAAAAAAAVSTDPKKAATPAAPAPVPVPKAATTPVGKTKICEMVQTFTFRQTGGQLAKIAIGKLPGEDKPKAVLQTPVGVFLTPGVTIKLDEKTEFKGSFVRCTAANCLADIELPKDAEATFATAKAATLTFMNAARQPITLSMSLRGFDGAFKSAMSQQQAK
jgi:invasion protein IalB